MDGNEPEHQPEEFDRQLDDLGAELRQKMAHEFRAEAEALEDDARKLVQRRRSLSDVAFELMSRGDRVSIATGDCEFRGHLVHVRGSLGILETEHATVDVNLDGPVVVRILERSSSGGVAPPGGSGSFRARLSEYELTGETVELIAPGVVEPLQGRLSVVAKDHVSVDDGSGRDWFVPISAMAFVVRPRRT